MKRENSNKTRVRESVVKRYCIVALINYYWTFFRLLFGRFFFAETYYKGLTVRFSKTSALFFMVPFRRD